MTMRHTSSVPPGPKSSIPPSMFMPLQEGIAGGKNAQTGTLVCGRRHTIGRFSVMYFGVIDDKAMMDVRRDGSFMGEIYASAGESGAVAAPMEGKKIVVDVIAADTREARVTISIRDIKDI